MKLQLPHENVGYAALLLLCTAIWYNVNTCDGHGRLIEPPSRASAWRYGFQTPPDYNDHELYCGGFTRQWTRNGGKCGECGDPWDVQEPRPHEHGGIWGIGVIVRRYSPGAEIPIRIELTASHMGYFEFRVCEHARAQQDCLDKHLLRVLGGKPNAPNPTDLDTRFYPRNGSRIYEIKAQLPELKCNHCVLQWRYIAGNNWGMCPNGNGAVGCGPQEEFRACADIALTDNLSSTPIRPLRPTVRTTQQPNIAYSPTSTDTAYTDESKAFNYTTWLIGILLILLFIAICCGIYYLHQEKNGRFKQLKAWIRENVNNRFCKKYKATNAKTTATASMPTTMLATKNITLPSSSEKRSHLNGNDVAPAFVSATLTTLPVAPPRTKRSARIKDLHSQDFSIA